MSVYLFISSLLMATFAQANSQILSHASRLVCQTMVKVSNNYSPKEEKATVHLVAEKNFLVADNMTAKIFPEMLDGVTLKYRRKYSSISTKDERSSFGVFVEGKSSVYWGAYTDEQGASYVYAPDAYYAISLIDLNDEVHLGIKVNVPGHSKPEWTLTGECQIPE